MAKHIRTALFSMAILVLAQPSPAVSQATSSDQTESFDIDTITCWEIGESDSQDRVSALLLVYGYVSGQRNRPTHDGASIESALEQTARLCASNPDMYVSEAIERAMR